MIGKTISHYKILEKLGEGGMGEVYLAEDLKLERKVAIKFLPQYLTRDKENVERFEREAKTAAALNHPNIVTIYEIAEENALAKAGKQTFIVMEYIDGESLRDKINRGISNLTEILNLTKQICDGLQEAHEADIVHRDIKPENILIDKSGRVKILDFGLAKLKGVRKLTKEASTLGTVHYMSPEQIEGKEVDQRTDIWSTGVILYEMITSQSPFRGDYEAAVMYSVVNEEAEPIKRWRTDVHDDLDQLVKKALKKSPKDRYQQVDEMLVDLRDVKGCIESTEESAEKKKAERSGAKREYIYGGVLIFFLLVVVIRLIFFKESNHVIDSIAVLPLENLSGDPEQEYFADGMTDALIAELSRISTFQRVISRQSVMQYKNSIKPMPVIAKELNVALLLEGTVLLIGDRVRITTQLIEGKKDRHLWAEQYESDLKDILDLQSEVAKDIAQNIELELTQAVEDHLTQTQLVDPETYKSYLQGKYHFYKFTQDGFLKAQEYYELAIREDPYYAPAYVGLAESYVYQGTEVGTGFLRSYQYYPMAKESIGKALDIDNNLGIAHSVLGLVHFKYDWDWSNAEKELLRGIELDPNSSMAHDYYAMFLTVVGRYDEAIAEVERSIELDPISLVINSDLGWVFYLSRDYNKSIEYSKKTIELDQNFSLAHWNLGVALIEIGQYEEAISECEKAMSLAIDNPSIKISVAVAYARSGQREKPLSILNEMLLIEEQRYVPPTQIAFLYTAIGDVDQAFMWLDKAFKQRDPSLTWIKGDPSFDNLRSDPRFEELMKKIGLNE